MRVPFDPDDWNDKPLSPVEIVVGLGFALIVHALAFLLCFVFSLSLRDAVVHGQDVPLWLTIVVFSLTFATAFQCIRTGVVFFEILNDYMKARK